MAARREFRSRGGFWFSHGGFDGFLRDGASVAEVDHVPIGRRPPACPATRGAAAVCGGMAMRGRRVCP